MFLLSAVMAAAVPAFAHVQRMPLVVTTDMALDDARALALLSALPGVELKAVAASDGASSPAVGAANARRCLDALGLDGVPVGVGRPFGKAPPPWRERSEALGWAALPPAATGQAFPDAVQVLAEAIEKAGSPAGVVAMGPLTDVADLFRRRPDLIRGVAWVLYYGDANSTWDPEAEEMVLASSIPVAAMVSSAPVAAFDEPLLKEIGLLGCPAARLIALTHADSRVVRLVREGHLKMWDERLPLYLADGSLGGFERRRDHPKASSLKSWDEARARSLYMRLLRDAVLQPRESVVLAFYPTDPGMLREDVQPFAEDILARHGLEEWKAVLLTNELHRHLGTYSIVGAKMGIRARELLSAGLDELEVVSSAGLKPPLSCLNDGLQAATGASLGRGTIRVVEMDAVPSAVFRKGGKEVRLTLKPELRERIEAEIAEALKKHGGLNAAYFEEVRRVSLRHWLELDRGAIFE